MSPDTHMQARAHTHTRFGDFTQLQCPCVPLSGHVHEDKRGIWIPWPLMIAGHVTVVEQPWINQQYPPNYFKVKRHGKFLWSFATPHQRCMLPPPPPSSSPDFKAARCHHVTHKKRERCENEVRHFQLHVSRARTPREEHEREGGTFVIFLS